MATRLRFEDAQQVDLRARFVFTDVGRTFVVHVRRGVAEVRERDDPDAELQITTTSTTSSTSRPARPASCSCSSGPDSDQAADRGWRALSASAPSTSACTMASSNTHAAPRSMAPEAPSSSPTQLQTAPGLQRARAAR